MHDSDGSNEETSYRRPPRSTRFPKGVSGNRKGRPPGKKPLPHDAVLGQMVVIREGGKRRKVTGAEAFVLQESALALAGDTLAARFMLAGSAEARRSNQTDEQFIQRIVRRLVGPGMVTPSMQRLGMAVKLDAFRPTTRIVLSPGTVENALARLGEKRLSLQDQDEVYRHTRTPRKVQWPDWWEVFG